MSLPEVMLVLREDSRREGMRALMALQGQAFSAFAVWDKDAGRRLVDFHKKLREQVQPPQTCPASLEQLESVLAGWGVEEVDQMKKKYP